MPAYASRSPTKGRRPSSRRPVFCAERGATAFVAGSMLSRRGLDVGVQAEQVARVVTFLKSGEARVVVALSCMHAAVPIIGVGEIHGLAACQRLHLAPP